MNRSHVTLPQILVAASTRHAHMVPESAGYLILALCEAVGCLPLAIPDAAIELSAEGAVAVTQQGKVVVAPEASQKMRELFARLLGVTTGATPRLAAVARPRDISGERSLDVLASEIEAALVPMNRSAGKRSLGRLARETLRAIESGTLALHLQARTAAKEAPEAANAAIAPLLVNPVAAAKQPIVPRQDPLPVPQPITPPPFMTADAPEEPQAEAEAASNPLGSRVTPTTPGLGLDTVATEAHVDSSVFGATPTYREGDDIAVQPASLPNLNDSPGVDSTNIKPVSCDPTQLSARDVQIDPALKGPRSDDSPKAVSTKRRVRRIEPPRAPQEITLASAGVEPVSRPCIETPAPSAPEENPSLVSVQDFNDCHDGQTQSAPKYHETLLGLAPVTPAPPAPEGPSSAEPLQSFEYVLVTPSALPAAIAKEGMTSNSLETNDIPSEPEDMLPSDLLHTASPSRAILVENRATFDAPIAHPEGFVPLDEPSDEPGRVDELLGTFGRPEEGEDEMLRRTASSLKELAGLDATPCVPSVSPAIRVPVMTNRATPAWVPDGPRQTQQLEPAPLVQIPRSLKQKLAVPLAMMIALCAGFAVVHWRLPEVVLRWVHPVEARQPAAPPTQAAAEQSVYVEP